MRGSLTDKIQELAKEYLGREITQTELRLYPYIDYCAKNGGYIKEEKLTSQEIKILDSYKETDLRRSRSVYSMRIWISRGFYDYIQKVLWESYIETDINEIDNKPE